jgi:hypothetical protein
MRHLHLPSDLVRTALKLHGPLLQVIRLVLQRFQLCLVRCVLKWNT